MRAARILMNELFDNTKHPPQPEQSGDVQHLFVGEAGDPTLFHSSGKPIVDTLGCTRFFMPSAMNTAHFSMSTRL